MFDGKKLFSKITDTAKKAVDGAQQAMGGIYESQVNKEAANNTSYSMYEVFTPAMGMGKKFIITEKSLIFGGEEFSYSELTPIVVVNPPMPLSNGTASTIARGNSLVLAYEYSQKDRFAKAMIYANEQIDTANGTVKAYKYLFQSDQGTKVEVYDDHLIFYALKSGLGNILSNSMQGGSAGRVMDFSDVTVTIGDIADNGKFDVTVIYGNESFVITLDHDCMAKVREAVEFIETVAASPSEWTTPESAKKTFERHTGAEHVFPLNEENLVVTEGMDVLNTYRLMFREFAIDCANAARTEFNKKVRDLTTYLEFFPKIYAYYMTMMCDKAMEIIIAEGIWSVTGGSLLEEHCNTFHLALDDFMVTVESVQLTVEKNQSGIATAMSFVPHLVGGGFGVKGAIKGIAGATAFNIARDSIESGLINSVTTINQAQQKELYDRINHDILFNNVFFDYWRVFATMIDTINYNGGNIWVPNTENNQRAANVFTNLRNPNFPKDQLTSVFIQILEINPYDADYQKYMLSQFGENDETIAIKNYFGYTSFDDPRIV